jgi:hypothetical protein
VQVIALSIFIIKPKYTDPPDDIGHSVFIGMRAAALGRVNAMHHNFCKIVFGDDDASIDQLLSLYVGNIANR